jgi:rhodanese-related sulfurtransferase
MSLFPHASFPSVTVAELAGTVAGEPDTLVVDVREPYEYVAGHLPGAVSMPLATVPVRHQELPRDRTVYLICQAGGRSGQAAMWLAKQGYQVANVDGGTGAWIDAGNRVVPGNRP